MPCSNLTTSLALNGRDVIGHTLVSKTPSFLATSSKTTQPVLRINTTGCVVISLRETWQRYLVSCSFEPSALATVEASSRIGTRSFDRSGCPVTGDGGRFSGARTGSAAWPGVNSGSQNEVRLSSSLVRATIAVVAMGAVISEMIAARSSSRTSSRERFFVASLLMRGSLARSNSRRSCASRSSSLLRASLTAFRCWASQSSRCVRSWAVFATMCSKRHSREYTCPDGVTTGSTAGCSDSEHHPNGSCESTPARISRLFMKPHFLRSAWEKTP
mmetsp:Transcript_16907/g.57216  ORF Transcript_16907/g.57216 Transcript_16907/m.57216 type:complete len:273 (+) Transcript_16907:200-1018(+)